MHRKRLRLILTLMLLMALIAGLSWMVHTAVTQERLNHALIVAIKQNDTQVALTLLAQGADPNSRDEPSHVSLWSFFLNRLHGNTAPTALLVALEAHHQNDLEYPPKDNPAIIKALLDKGADANVIDEESGDTALQLATEADYHQGRRKSTILLLIEHGANVHVQDAEGLTPLMTVLYSPGTDDDLINAFVNRGANINIDSRLVDITPLMKAVQSQNPGYVKLLLSHHVNPNDKTYTYGTALSIAKKDPYPKTSKGRQIIQMLKQAGAEE